MRDEVPTFDRLLAVMGPFTTNLSVEPEFFNNVLNRIHGKFGIEFIDVSEAYGTLSRTARVLGALYRGTTAPLDRKTLITKLTQLSASARATINAMEPFRGGIKAWENCESLSPADPVTYAEHFLEIVGLTYEFHDIPIEEVDRTLETTVAGLEVVARYCDALLPGVRGASSKQGQRGLGWYYDYVGIMLEVASQLGINPTTDARGSKVADFTPFTMLVFECEKIFPREGWSDNETACARRIERCLKWIRAARQNSPEQN